MWVNLFVALILDETLARKAVVLEYSREKRLGRSRRRRSSKRRSQGGKPLSAGEKRRLKVFDIKPEHQRYELFLPLHDLWKQYIMSICNGLRPGSSPQLVQQKLLKADFHGAILTVVRSKCPSYVGTTGILVQEFKHIFKIITKEDRLKVIPKNNSVFAVEVNGFVSHIYGSKFEYRASERSAKKFKAVESSFRMSGKPLATPGRVLFGEGQLLKRSRRRCQPKVFFLFSDVLVYGSVVVAGRWYKNQKTISLADIQLEDLEDSTWMENQWLIRTPRKSFYVVAGCPKEKQAWMEHIVACRDRWIQTVAAFTPFTFAATWIPDGASAVCMRCCNEFTAVLRRHHCRNCGFLVCGACSKQHAVLRHIHPIDLQRVCRLCSRRLLQEQQQEEEHLYVDVAAVLGEGEQEEEGKGMTLRNFHGWLNSQTQPHFMWFTLCVGG
ncbi:Ribonuclease P protein subunit p29 [Merluccius polli]|uniref:Ribonuclease P protein subunit p29 n=1 Tax=Merluccius polli TaxID=89951 RepID=A0AA47MG44_MERPO|nr:Ribonuclease P protein subunit p29 [Merluccius polli]